MQTSRHCSGSTEAPLEIGGGSTESLAPTRSAAGEDLRRGNALARAHAYRRATPYLHAASWSVARAGPPRERLDAQLKLADSQLHARDYRSALANYRFAIQLAEEIDPDSCEYWLIRASLAQALRRIGQLDQARAECAAVQDRLSGAPLAGRPADARLLARMTLHLGAQLDASAQRFVQAADAALKLAEAFLTDGDGTRSAAQYLNASVWCLFAADRAHGDWRMLHARAGRATRRARAILARQPSHGDDELRLDLDMLLVFNRLVSAKRLDDARASAAMLETASRRLDRIERSIGPSHAPLRIQAAILRLRIVERRGRVEEVEAATRNLRARMHENLAAAELLIRQDLGFRFRWDRQAIPIGQPDPDLEEFLRESRT